MGAIHYTPFPMRLADDQYRTLMNVVRNAGEDVDSQQKARARMVFGQQMRFRLSQGFPIITERDLCSADEGRASIFAMALGELFAFLNGARTLDEMKGFGCSWWAPWVTEAKCQKRGLEPGDLGPGSYGPAWRSFPTAEGGSFDQIAAVIQQIRELPHLRTHFVSPWIPQYTFRGEGLQQRVVVVPCHGWLHVHVNPERGTLSLHHIQRSADIPVGLVSNLIQYAALTMMLAQVTGYTPHELVYTLSNAHIFHGQFADVDAMLATVPQRLPTVTLDESVTDIFAFRPEHFTVEDYHPQLPRRRIWTPV